MAKTSWLEKVSRELTHVCNGDTEKHPKLNMTECTMKNGNVTASITDDGTRTLSVRKQDKKGTGLTFQKVSMESQSDEMVVTRSLSGSIEFLHRMGNSPEVRIEQEGKRLGRIKINAYNAKVKTSIDGYFD